MRKSRQERRKKGNHIAVKKANKNKVKKEKRITYLQFHVQGFIYRIIIDIFFQILIDMFFQM